MIKTLGMIDTFKCVPFIINEPLKLLQSNSIPEWWNISDTYNSLKWDRMMQCDRLIKWSRVGQWDRVIKWDSGHETVTKRDRVIKGDKVIKLNSVQI